MFDQILATGKISRSRGSVKSSISRLLGNGGRTEVERVVADDTNQNEGFGENGRFSLTLAQVVWQSGGVR